MLYGLQEDLERKVETKQQSLVKKERPPGADYWLVDRNTHGVYQGNLDVKTFTIGGVKVGNKPLIIAGPCTVHSREQTLEIAEKVKEAGADMLRGGAYKPRTSPYFFRGLGRAGLEILAEARERTGLPLVTEVMDPRLVELVGNYADMLQIGSRNMQNYPLLMEIGRYAAKYDKAVLLKTSLMPKLKEILCAAEYLAVEGAEKIIICERGMAVTTGETRNTPNPLLLRELRRTTYLPIIGDPSHSTGDRDLVCDASDMYLAAKANGLIVEVIRDDEPKIIDGVPVCDYNQGLPMSQFKDYVALLRQRNI